MENCNALIGASGYVGTTLLRQVNFNFRYQSGDVHKICKKILFLKLIKLLLN